MKVISAYMLAVVGGNTSPTAADVNKILSSIGANLDGEESKALDSMIAAFGERSHEEILKEGLELIKDCGGSGGGGVVALLAQQLLPAAAMLLQQRRRPPPKRRMRWPQLLPICSEVAMTTKQLI